MEERNREEKKETRSVRHNVVWLECLYAKLLEATDLIRCGLIAGAVASIFPFFWFLFSLLLKVEFWPIRAFLIWALIFGLVLVSAVVNYDPEAISKRRGF